MASYKDAASLLFLDLGLVFVLLPDLAHVLFLFIIRVYLLLLFFEGSKGDELHGGSNTGRPQERGRMSRYALLLLDVDHARVLLLHQGNVRIIIHFPFKLPYFKNSEEGGCVGGGSAGGPWYLVSSFALHCFLN